MLMDGVTILLRIGLPCWVPQACHARAHIPDAVPPLCSPSTACSNLATNKTLYCSFRCEDEPEEMIGGEELGGCRVACKICTPCEDEDISCQETNRIKAGYLPRQLLDADL